MPVKRNIPLSLEMNEVLRREGLREYSKLRPEMKALIRELLASMKNDHLLEPAIAYEIYSITEVRRDQLSLEGDVAVHGQLLPSILPDAKELAVVVCTIGPALEKQVKEYFDKKEPLRGVLLDGIGSAAVDSLAEEACKFTTGEALSRGYQASSPISPGMLGFPISEQWQLFELVPAEEIRVSLTPLGIMVPRKSVSMVIGIGPQMATWTRKEVCARCNLKKTCPYKIRA